MYEIFVREAKLKCARVYFRAFFRARRKIKIWRREKLLLIVKEIYYLIWRARSASYGQTHD